jgi:hypothetical protein
MPKKSKHPGLRAHSWRTAGGEIRTAYYLDNRAGQHQADGPQEIRLGTDYERALQRWRELVLLAPMQAGTIGEAMARWERDELPGYRESTRRDYGLCLASIRPVFGPAAWPRVDMPVLARYLAERKAKTRANRELALLSIIWRRAMLWGLTTLPWPAAGLERSKWKNREKPRAFEPGPDHFAAVYSHASQVLRDAMDIISATGLRVRDAISVGIPADGVLRGAASKTGKRFAIDMTASAALAPLLERRKGYPAAHLCLLSHPGGGRVTERQLIQQWQTARAKAVAAHPKLPGLAGMYLRDLRKLAAEDAESLAAAAALLQHDDPRLTRAHYRRTPAAVKAVR